MRFIHGALAAVTAAAVVAFLPIPAAHAAEGESIAVSATSLDFGLTDPLLDGAPQTLTVTSNGTAPVTLVAPVLSSTQAFRITGDTCTGVALAVGQQCQITVVPHPPAIGTWNATMRLADQSGTVQTDVTLAVDGALTPKGTFYPLAPQRILDTRSGVGAPKGAVGPGKTVRLQTTGRGGVPAAGVSAVVLNVTVTGPTGNGILTVFPTGAARPNTSAVNYTRGWTGANSVTVGVGTGGRVDIYNAGATTQIIADIAGYFAADTNIGNHGYVGGAYHPITPLRLSDTRLWGSKLPAEYYFNSAATYNDPEVDRSVRAFAVNITAVAPMAAGFLTAWNGDPYTLPYASTVNYAAGKTVANMAIVPTIPCVDCGEAEGWPSIGVYTSATTHVLVDLVGVFDDSTQADGLRFTPITPTRIVDTRGGLGIPAALGPNGTATVDPPAAVAPADTNGLALNVTAVAPTANTFLSVWPSDDARPWASNLNPERGRNVPNAVITGLGSEHAFNVFNSLGTTHVLVDVVGRYWLYPATATPTAARGAAEGSFADGKVMRLPARRLPG